MQDFRDDPVYYNVTFFDGIRGRRDHRICIPGRDMEYAFSPKPNSYGSRARQMAMLVALVPVRLTTRDMNWEWFTFVNLDIPPNTNITQENVEANSRAGQTLRGCFIELVTTPFHLPIFVDVTVMDFNFTSPGLNKRGDIKCDTIICGNDVLHHGCLRG